MHCDTTRDGADSTSLNSHQPRLLILHSMVRIVRASRNLRGAGQNVKDNCFGCCKISHVLTECIVSTSSPVSITKNTVCVSILESPWHLQSPFLHKIGVDVEPD
jgi:hypothetical protein